MAVYEYRCKTCDMSFEMRRSMSDSNAPATCPAGHTDSMRKLSAFASVGGASAPAAAAPRPTGGGGCGGACACG
jgi:putative FmdB family regulatory protein